MNARALIDCRGSSRLLCTPVRSVPLALWPLRTLLAHVKPSQIRAVTRAPAIAALLARHGVKALGAMPATSPRTSSPPTRFPPTLVIDPLRPFVSGATLQAALAHGVAQLALVQRSPIEALEVRDEATLELVRAVAMGLPPDHPCIAGLSGLRMPTGVKIGLVVCDVDGTLTDGGIGFADDPHAFRTFHTHDGLGTHQLIEAGIKVAWLSATKSGASIERRAAMLGVHAVDAGGGEKGARLVALCKRLRVPLARTIYLGDDVNDLPAMRKAALSACPSDARPEVRAQADLVLDTSGGRGALRELADIILSR